MELRLIDMVSFDAEVVNTSSTSMEISAEVFSTLKMFELRYFVVLIDLTCEWAQIEKQRTCRGT